MRRTSPTTDVRVHCCSRAATPLHAISHRGFSVVRAGLDAEGRIMGQAPQPRTLARPIVRSTSKSQICPRVRAGHVVKKTIVVIIVHS